MSKKYSAEEIEELRLAWERASQHENETRLICQPYLDALEAASEAEAWAFGDYDSAKKSNNSAS